MEGTIKTNKSSIEWIKSHYSFKVKDTNRSFKLIEKWNIDGFEYGLYYSEKIKGFIELKLKAGKIVDSTNLLHPSANANRRRAMVIELEDLKNMIIPLSKKRIYPTIDKKDPKTYMYVGRLMLDSLGLRKREKEIITLQILKHLSIDHKDLMEKAFDEKSMVVLSKIEFTDEFNNFLQRSMLQRLKETNRYFKHSSPDKIKKLFAKTKTEQDFFDEYNKNKKRV